MPLTGVPLAYGQTPPDRPAMVVKVDNAAAGATAERVQHRRHRVRGDRQRQPHAVRPGVPQPGQRRRRRADPVRTAAGRRPVRLVRRADVRVERREPDGRERHRQQRLPRPQVRFPRDVPRPQPPVAAPGVRQPRDAVEPAPSRGRAGPEQQFAYRTDGEAPPASRRRASTSCSTRSACDGCGIRRSGTYRREMDGQPHNDASTGQITTNNVVVLVMNYVQGVSDSPDAQSIGYGEAFVFSRRQCRARHVGPPRPAGAVHAHRRRRHPDRADARAHVRRAAPPRHHHPHLLTTGAS